MFYRLLQRAFRWLSGTFSGQPSVYRTAFLEELPDRLDKHIIYVLGEGDYTWSASMICPCGCGDVLHMSLHPEGRPRWELIRHSDATISLTPSIWRKVGCRSHFFFKHGRIHWCK